MLRLAAVALSVAAAACRDAAPIDASCASGLVVLGPVRAELRPRRPVLPVVTGGRETLTLVDAFDAGVLATSATTESPELVAVDIDGGVLEVRAALLDSGGAWPVLGDGGVRIESDRGCATVPISVAAASAPFGPTFFPHSCSGSVCFGCGVDGGAPARPLPGGHAHVCISRAAGGGYPAAFEVIDEDQDPCGSFPGCTRLRFDLVELDTPLDAGEAVTVIVPPPPIDLAVGATEMACFGAGAPDGPIVDDGWTYAAPAIVDVSTAHTDFAPVAECIIVRGLAAGSGTITATLAGVSGSVPVTVH